MALLASLFINMDVLPDENLRVQTHCPEILKSILEELSGLQDEKPLEDKFNEINNKIDLFIFYRYHEGFVTNGETGFSPKHGNPGCVYHKRVYTRFFEDLSDAQFRNRGRKMGELAYEFFKKKSIHQKSKITMRKSSTPLD